MKHVLILTSALLVGALHLSAQKTFKKAFGNASGKQKIVLYIEQGEVSITGYAGNELVVETNQEFSGPPDRAKGLKPLYNTANDNTGIGLDIQEAGGIITIRKAAREEASYKFKVPAGADIRIEEIDWGSDGMSLKDLTGEVEIVGHGSNVKLENVTGPVVANSISGNFEVVFTRLNQEKPTHINATSGYIDVTLPADTKANLNLTAISGESFTDFDIKFPEDERGKGLKQMHRYSTAGTINGGGVELTLNAISGNIYLRKK